MLSVRNQDNVGLVHSPVSENMDGNVGNAFLHNFGGTSTSILPPLSPIPSTPSSLPYSYTGLNSEEETEFDLDDYLHADAYDDNELDVVFLDQN